MIGYADIGDTGMRLGGRLAAAIEIIEDIHTRHRPAADALKDWGLSHRFAGSGDRGAIGNIVYDALRRRRSAAWLFQSDAPRALALGALLLEWDLGLADIDAATAKDGFSPPPLSDDERRAVAENTLAQAPDPVRADCPDWCIPLIEDAFGADWVEEAAALASRPPLDLRVNPLRASRERVLQEIERSGAGPTRIAPYGVRIPPIRGSGRHPNVQAEPGFRKGWFEVQDEGSQLTAELAGATAAMQVLDYCAGAGGKTLSLSAAMENGGQLFAYDAEKARLAPIFERLRRAECRNVQVTARAGELEPLAGRMDLVVVDAPCSGSGTWRRRPDAKWRLTARQVEVRLSEQAAILQRASRFVKPGGRLAYITCSVFPEENQGQVRNFLEANADFAAVDAAALWRDRFPAHAARCRKTDPGLLLSPRLTGTDGFFFAMVQKIG